MKNHIRKFDSFHPCQKKNKMTLITFTERNNISKHIINKIQLNTWALFQCKDELIFVKEKLTQLFENKNPQKYGFEKVIIDNHIFWNMKFISYPKEKKELGIILNDTLNNNSAKIKSHTELVDLRDNEFIFYNRRCLYRKPDIYTPSFIFRLNLDKNFYVSNDRISPSIRYSVFHNKGTSCVKCGLTGTHFIKERTFGDKNYHLNLYADNGQMLTIDHIYPKSLGGNDSLDNLQPMCEKCNLEKGNKIEIT